MSRRRSVPGHQESLAPAEVRSCARCEGTGLTPILNLCPTCGGTGQVTILPRLEKLYDRVWYWKPTAHRPVDRRGERCRIVCVGRMNSALIEFPDGYRVVTSRHAVRRAR